MQHVDRKRDLHDMPISEYTYMHALSRQCMAACANVNKRTYHLLASHTCAVCPHFKSSNVRLAQPTEVLLNKKPVVHSMLQVLADAPVMDTALPISPLDACQSRIKQEDCRELHVLHSSADIDYQVGWLQNSNAANIVSLSLHCSILYNTCIAANQKKLASYNCQLDVPVDVAGQLLTGLSIVWTLNARVWHMFCDTITIMVTLPLNHIKPAKTLIHACMLSSGDTHDITLISGQDAETTHTAPERSLCASQASLCRTA